MSHSALPTAAEVTTMLASLTPPITLPGGFDVASELAAVITEVGERTHYRPFFQTSATPAARTFDPPGAERRGSSRGGSRTMALGNGLLSLTSVLVGVNAATGAAGTLLVQGLDFWLWPPNAVANGQPYTHIDFSAVRRGMPQSIVITGVWGYCSGTIPDDMWRAMRDLAAAGCLETFVQGLLNNVIEWHQADRMQKRDAQLLRSTGEMLARRAGKVLYRYRLLDS